MSVRQKATRAAAAGRALSQGWRGARFEPEVKVRTTHGTVEVGTGVRLRRGCHVAVFGTAGAPARLVLGDGVVIGARSRINVSCSITIGARTEISWLVQVMDTDFHRITELDGSARPHRLPVVIGEHVLIGTGAIITKGVTIGDGAVIGAGSVVSRDVPAGTVVAGNPARPIRQVADWV